MTVTLVRSREEMWVCNAIWWTWALVLADIYGGAPGRPHRYRPWDPRRYDPYAISGRDTLKLTEEEAAAMADALERALDDIPDRPTGGGGRNPLELFAGEDGKRFLGALMMYCRQGGFEVD
jgi:hypothetical protein